MWGSSHGLRFVAMHLSGMSGVGNVMVHVWIPVKRVTVHGLGPKALYMDKKMETGFIYR